MSLLPQPLRQCSLSCLSLPGHCGGQTNVSVTLRWNLPIRQAKYGWDQVLYLLSTSERGIGLLSNCPPPLYLKLCLFFALFIFNILNASKLKPSPSKSNIYDEVFEIKKVVRFFPSMRDFCHVLVGSKLSLNRDEN